MEGWSRRFRPTPAKHKRNHSLPVSALPIRRPVARHPPRSNSVLCVCYITRCSVPTNGVLMAMSNTSAILVHIGVSMVSGALCILYYWRNRKDTTKESARKHGGDIHIEYIAMTCVAMVVAALVPLRLWWDDINGLDSNANIAYLFPEAVGFAWASASDVVGLLLSTSIIPIVVFMFKFILGYRSGLQQTSIYENIVVDVEVERRQSKLITWIIKIMLGVVVFFTMLTSMGISQSAQEKIAQIVGLGVSFSMRESYSTLWAGVSVSNASRLTVGTHIKLETNNPKSPTVTVVETGGVFTICREQVDDKDTDEHGKQILLHHIPNSQLLQRGFTIVSRYVGPTQVTEA